MPSIEEINSLVERELLVFRDQELAQKVRPMLRLPHPHILHWEYGDNERCECWLIADLGERNIWVAYFRHGHGALGYPWGLVFKHSARFGMSDEWHESLESLCVEWFAV